MRSHSGTTDSGAPLHQSAGPDGISYTVESRIRSASNGTSSSRRCVADTGERTVRELDQRDLHRVAEENRRQAILLDRPEVLAQGCAEEERLVVGDERASRHRAIDRNALHAHEQLAHAHAVLRQGPGLVGADHRRRAERLDRGQVPDQHVPLRHALTRQHERQGERREQTFRHHRHDDADGEDEGVPERHPCEAAHREEEHADGDRYDSDHPREVRDLRPQRGDDLSGGLRELRDPPELGAHAGREHDRPRLAGDQ